MNYLIVLALSFFGPPQSKSACSILVKIDGIQQNRGQIVINLYNSKAGFPTKPRLSFKQFLSPIKNLQAELLIESLPPGEYAITAYQDVNFNSTLDLNILNMPIEKVGCSNNPKALFIPSYNDAKFKLTEQLLKKEITIK